MASRKLDLPGKGILALILLSSTGHAQDGKPVAPATPEAVALQFFEFMKAGEMEAAANLMHPGRLKAFRTQVASLIEMARKDGKIEQLVPVFGSVKTMEGMKDLDDVHFFATLLNGFLDAQPDARKALATSRSQIIGTVAEGQDLVHVIHRTTYKVEGENLDIVNDCPTRRDGDGKGWGIEPLGDLESIVVQFEKRIEGKFEIPNLKETKVQYLGRVVENGEQAHIVYRATTPWGKASMTKLYVLSIKNSDPEWPTVSKADPAEMTRMIQKRNAMSE